jgi:predicted KAP-like P-loop ATPase
MLFGLKDIPLESFNDDALEIGDYAKSLSDFIQQCETPLTIALQGDWGSGKTSLMNLIKSSAR